MSRRILSALFLGLIGASVLGGCYATGKATGEAVRDVKHGAHEFKEGYQDGRR